MRTTVTLDPDVEALIRNRMREQGISFKEALNQALRSALLVGASSPQERFVQRTFRMGFRPEASLDRALSLAAALEDHEIARRLSVGK